MHNAVRVHHVSTFLTTTGGVEKLLRNHLLNDQVLGIESRATILFERQENLRTFSSAAGLGLTGWSTVRRAQAVFSASARSWQPDITIYHDGWGLPFLHGFDGAKSRAIILHCPSTFYKSLAYHCRSLVAGMLTVSPGVAEEWAGNPDWSHSRITGWLPLPIEPVDDHFQNRQPPSSSRRYLTLGYCGRLERGCKRADRIPTLLQEMDRIRLDYRFLILGTGPLEHKLRHELAGHPRVTFFGHLGGSKYWEILGSCDALVSLSDVEGMGMAVLDAMSIGVLPYYPDIGGGAERYVRRLGLGFLYPSGDLRFLAGELQTLGRLDPAENSRLRQTCREIVRPHTWEQYRDTYLRFLNKLIGSSSPCHFKPQPSSWQRLASLLPLGVIRRAMPRLLLVPWGLAAGPRSP